MSHYDDTYENDLKERAEEIGQETAFYIFYAIARQHGLVWEAASTAAQFIEWRDDGDEPEVFRDGLAHGLFTWDMPSPFNFHHVVTDPHEAVLFLGDAYEQFGDIAQLIDDHEGWGADVALRAIASGSDPMQKWDEVAAETGYDREVA